MTIAVVPHPCHNSRFIFMLVLIIIPIKIKKSGIILNQTGYHWNRSKWVRVGRTRFMGTGVSQTVGPDMFANIDPWEMQR